MKGQSNPVIARSPRNSFRASLAWFLAAVEHWMDAGPSQGTNSNQTPNAVKVKRGSQTVGDKLHSREGNNPDRQLRSPSNS